MRSIGSFIVLLAQAFCVQEAFSLVLLSDELFPRSAFSEHIFPRTPSYFQAELLSAAGRDSVNVILTEQQEQRFFAALGVSSQVGFALGDRLRVDVRANALRSMAQTNVTSNVVWKKAESASELLAGGFLRWHVKDGFRLGAGAQWLLRPAAADVFEFAQESGRTDFAAYNILAPEYLITKESGSQWSVGLAWRPKVSRVRRIARQAASETFTVDEDVALDEQWSSGFVAQLQNNRQLNLDLRLQGVAESETRDAKTGATSEDSQRRRYEVSALYGLGEFSGHVISLGVGYQSIGYTDQAHVTPQNIPLWSLLFRDEFRSQDVNVRLSASLGMGDDTQSLPDLNARYQRLIVSLQAGVVF